ncbi:SRPBCC family protein [Jannaschia pohangensis]|uniref:Uncharacterized conserved protein YndB, AHSA1/START domain n=1 Tax=Jannaschia pohangensis TaxID=390807 RepID=A0A1I3U5N8_9RHOB|nr:SRPBCC family protein [Jannaschia pohangensis]SFJ78330.1 Uncharacterized conserved protein YndB, AHSA1/START domain [Jannaschia pohangensis]
MNLDPNTDLTFTRRLKVPRALVWKCWTTPEHIRNFFVPRPHTIEACDIDLRVGGRFNTTMNVDGNRMENKGVYLEIIDGARLVFTDTYGEGWKPAADPFMTAILDLSDDDDGGTIYTATARHRSPEACKRHEDMGFFGGWGTVVTQLEEYAQSLG